MSEINEAEATSEAQEPQDGEQAGQAKTFDADYVEKLRKESAKYRTEAKANAEAAAELAQIRESQKSDAEKVAERLAAAEKAASEAEAKVVRRDIAIEHKLSADDAALLDTITDETTLRALAARLATAGDAGARSPRPDPNQGKSSRVPASTGDQFAAFFTSQIGG